MTGNTHSQYLKDHIPKIGNVDNSTLIECLLVLGISSFKSITEGKIRPKKSIKMLKKATERIVKDYFELKEDEDPYQEFQEEVSQISIKIKPKNKKAKK
jgi:hypothetical protein